MGKFTPVNKEWLASEGFNIIELDTNKISEVNKDKKTYSPFFESHRFGYGGNKIVSQQIYEYLKEKGFL